MGRPIPNSQPPPAAPAPHTRSEIMTRFVGQVNDNLFMTGRSMRPVVLLEPEGRLPAELIDVIEAGVLRTQRQGLRDIGDAAMATIDRQLHAIAMFECSIRQAAIAGYVESRERGDAPPVLHSADEEQLQDDMTVHLRRLERARWAALKPDEDDVAASDEAAPAPTEP